VSAALATADSVSVWCCRECELAGILDAAVVAAAAGVDVAILTSSLV
jgi:hypothetical protein